MWVELELKLMADVGILGVPNAGKSTLLSIITNAKPKIGNYPFTTLVPNLGVYEMDQRGTVIADIPVRPNAICRLSFVHPAVPAAIVTIPETAKVPPANVLSTRAIGSRSGYILSRRARLARAP
eukprot:4653896-Pyramimonas_sp.AAC.3